MRKYLWLVAGSLIILLSGCGSNADVEGEWDLTLSLFETSGADAGGDSLLKASYTGRLSLFQTFDSFQGTGWVLGPGGLDCRVEFIVTGSVLDTSVIPVKFDFGGGDTCEQNEFDADATMTLQLLDEGYVLYGHNTYTRENQKLYASASLRLYD